MSIAEQILAGDQSGAGWVYQPAPKPAPGTWRNLAKTGRRSDGYGRDGGKLVHAVRDGDAACGTKPGRRADWSDWDEPAVTCERCSKKLDLLFRS